MKRKLLYQLGAFMALISFLVTTKTSFSQTLTIDENFTPLTWSAATLPVSNTSYAWGSWDATNKIMTMNRSIVIDRTGSTRVEFVIDGITVVFGTSHSLTVEAGEKFTLQNGGKLTATSSGSYWLGVIANGSSGAVQFNTALGVPEVYEPYNGSTSYNTSQTLVEFNTSEIQYAQTGILSDAGAIILANGSTLRDCQVGIEIKNYTHPSISGVSHMDERNASYISGCSFLTYQLKSYTTSNSDFSSYRMLKLDNVFGIHIQGSNFFNYTINQPSYTCTGRGYGLYAANASFAMHKSGTATKNTTTNCISYDGSGCAFLGHSKGIYFVESSSPTQRANSSIVNANFNGCYASIDILRGERHLISDCDIETSYSTNLASSHNCTENVAGIRIKDAASFVVQRNTLSGFISNSVPLDVDLVSVDNGGSNSNRIQKNSFTGDFTTNRTDKMTGIRMNNDNSLIEPWCGNSFASLDNAIWVESGPINSYWVATGAAGNLDLANTFSSNQVDLRNSINTVITYCENHTKWSNFIQVAPFGYNWQQTEPDAENSCPDLDCFSWYPTSIQKIEVPAYNLYPNPALPNGSVQVSFEKAFTGTISVYNALGVLVQQSQVRNSTQETLSTHSYMPGIYMVVFTTKAGGGRATSLLSVSQ